MSLQGVVDHCSAHEAIIRILNIAYIITESWQMFTLYTLFQVSFYYEPQSLEL